MRASLVAFMFFISIASQRCFVYATTCGAAQASGNGYLATWVNNCEDQSVTVTVTSQSPGWIAWGVNNGPQMVGADIAYFYMNSTGPVIADCTNNDEGIPPSPDASVGGQNNIYAASASQTASSSTMTFTRKWNTGDPKDFVITDGAPGYLLWAYGSSNQQNYHGSNKRATPMNFNTSCCPGTGSTFGSAASTGSGSSTLASTATSTGSSSSTTGGGSGCTPGAVFKGSASNKDNSWTLSWVIDCTSKTFNATTTANTRGWIGMGLGVTTLMYPGDIVMAYVDDTTSVAYATDRWATAHAQPRLDTALGGTNGINDVTGTQTASTTTVSWTRSLAAGDQYDLAIVPADMNILWAISSTDDLTNQHDNSDAIIVNFYTGKVSANTQFNKKLAHGIFMLLAFGIMFAPAAYIAAYLKPIGHTWYVAHVTTNILAGVLFLIGFALIVSEKTDTKNAHFVVPHEQIGLALFIIVAAQIVLGFLANALWSPERKGTPIFPDKMHWFIGGSIIILGFANIQLGFVRYGYAPNALHILQGLFYGVIAISALGWVIGRIWSVLKQGDPHASQGLPKFLISTFFVWVLVGIVLIIVIAAEMYKYGN